MLINAPYKLLVIDDPESGSRELHLTFSDAFREEPLEKRGQHFRKHIESLQQNINTLNDEDPNRAGMMAMLQISQELLPHILDDEIPLTETIVIEIRQDVVLGNLIGGIPVQ